MAGEPKRRNRYDRLRGVRRLARPFETFQVERFGGSVVSIAFRTPVLVLHTTGRRSGSERHTTLAFTRTDDGSLVVVAGAGGQARVPDWVANLRAQPRAAVTFDRARIEVCAVELTDAEREATWRTLREVWPRIDTYERRAGRTVPVFRLIPGAERRLGRPGRGSGRRRGRLRRDGSAWT